MASCAGLNTDKKTLPIMQIKWVLGTPYFVQGTSNLTLVPILYFIKFMLGMGDVGGQLFDSLRNAGWFAKPVWGYISDRLPLLGYRRKSWFVLMALLAVLFWIVNAILVVFEVRTPALFLLTFNLAFATYAFVDVVCDALMVTWGRKLKRVGSFVNFQWTVLAVANAAAVFLGGSLQERVQAGSMPLAWIFLATGILPLCTAVVGLRCIEEACEQPDGRSDRRTGRTFSTTLGRMGMAVIKWCQNFPAWLTENRTMFLLVLFIFFWKFSPSVGYIERSYLIDVRQFAPTAFGIILSAGSLTFLVSILAYRWFVKRFRSLDWYHYLYAMVAIGVLSFPLSFFPLSRPQSPLVAVDFVVHSGTCELCAGLEPL